MIREKVAFNTGFQSKMRLNYESNHYPVMSHICFPEIIPRSKPEPFHVLARKIEKWPEYKLFLLQQENIKDLY